MPNKKNYKSSSFYFNMGDNLDKFNGLQGKILTPYFVFMPESDSWSISIHAYEIRKQEDCSPDTCRNYWHCQKRSLAESSNQKL